MKIQPRHNIFCCLCLLLAGVNLTSTSTAATPTPLPAWQVLEFEQRAFWATARSRVEIPAVPASEQEWNLTATSSVVDNSEQVIISFVPANGQAVKRTRLSRGEGQRLKSYDYQADYILRERRNPVSDPNAPPDQWPISSRKEITYPVSREETIITDGYALLLLADRLQAENRESDQVLVHTDFNFYQVRMICGNGIPITVDYQIKGGEHVSGKRDTRAVALHVSPLGPQLEKPDFSLLGLQGDIILFFDKTSGLLLQVRGTAPRIGSTEINLKAVTMREPPA